MTATTALTRWTSAKSWRLWWALHPTQWKSWWRGEGAAGEARVGSPAAGQAEFSNARRASRRSTLPL